MEVGIYQAGVANGWYSARQFNEQFNRDTAMSLKAELFKNHKALSKLIPMSKDSLLKLKEIHQNLPQEYIDFMLSFGSGEVGDEAFMLYSDLKNPSAIYGNDFTTKESFLLIGDDFSGYCSGFRLSDWSIVEFAPTSLNPTKVADSFCEFVQQKIDWSVQ